MVKKDMVKLGMVANLYQPQTISQSDFIPNGAYNVFGANGIIGNYSEYNHAKSELVVTCRGATCGNVHITPPKCWITGNAMVVEPNGEKEILQKFLYFALKGSHISLAITGAAQPQITRANLRNIFVYLPPLEEQKAIAAELDKIQSLISKRKKQLEKLDVLVKAKFVEMFGAPVTNPMGWEVKALLECLNSIESGKSFVCTNHSRIKSNPAILKLSAISNGIYLHYENKETLENAQFFPSIEIKDYDLLFSRKNTPELVGVSAFVFSTPQKLMMPDLIFRLNTKENCNKLYLWQLINHELFRAEVTKLASGSAKSMSNISKERLKTLKIPLPSIELQNDFATYVQKIEKMKIYMQKGLEKLETLYKSKMQEYFE